VKTGLVIFAHGSRVEAANEAVRAVAAGLARARPFERVEAAFLELGQPDLAGAVQLLATDGVGRILVLPYFLTLGIHLERDLPAIVDTIAKSYQGMAIRVTSPLDGHPALVRILEDRARDGLEDWDAQAQ
jgi:sirohydrochlorin ferrochelatase